MDNAIIEKEYDEFIQKASCGVKQSVDSLVDYKIKGKEYQDEIVRIFRDASIQISNRCKLNDDKKISVIADILESSPIVDDDLYKFAINIKERYKTYFQGNFAIWSDKVNKGLFKDDELDKFINQRIDKSLQSNKDQYNILCDYMKIKIGIMEEKLHLIPPKNKYKSVLRKICDDYKQDLYYIEKEYEEWEQNENKRKAKFHNNIIKMMQKYILSHEYSDKNLRREYIKSFLWDKLQYHISFTQGSDYLFQLGKNIESNSTNIAEDLYDVFMKNYEKNIDEPKKKIESKKQQKTMLKNMMPELDFGQ